MPPAPPVHQIRAPRPEDAEGIAALLGELGYPARADEVPPRLARLDRFARASAEHGAAAFVAARDRELLGLATVHAYPVLHRAGDVAQLTALVVTARERGLGVGRALVDAAARWARARGCSRLTVTTALHRADAHAFYERLGFEHTGRRYVKGL